MRFSSDLFPLYNDQVALPIYSGSHYKTATTYICIITIVLFYPKNFGHYLVYCYRPDITTPIALFLKTIGGYQCVMDTCFLWYYLTQKPFSIFAHQMIILINLKLLAVLFHLTQIKDIIFSLDDQFTNSTLSNISSILLIETTPSGTFFLPLFIQSVLIPKAPAPSISLLRESPICTTCSALKPVLANANSNNSFLGL